MTAASRQAAASLDCYYEARIGARVIPVLPGGHRVIDEKGVAVFTLLGSCVAACIRDRVSGVGGLNHFLLPSDEASGPAARSPRYGVYAMEVLINEILKTGASRENLEAKAFGGGRVIESSQADSIGDRNARFVVSYLQSEGIRLVASDLGGDRARRVYFFPSTGQVSIQRLAIAETRNAALADQRLSSSIEQRRPKGSVELF